MSEITVRKRHKKSSLHGWLVCFALIAAFGLMGLSLSAFQSNLYVFGTMSTADFLVELEGKPHLYGYNLEDRGLGEKSDTGPQEQPAKLMTHQVSIVTEAETKGNEGSKDPKKSNPPSMKAFTNDAKSITVSIENAYPGDIYRLQYTVINKGTIPVVIDLMSTSDNPHLKVENSLRPDEILGPGESRDEELTITVAEGADADKEYHFSVELNYKQWNAN